MERTVCPGSWAALVPRYVPWTPAGAVRALGLLAAQELLRGGAALVPSIVWALWGPLFYVILIRM